MKKSERATNLSFDDILLVPADRSNTIRRVNADISMTLGNPNNKDAWLKLRLPFIVAPMERISSTKILSTIADNFGFGFVQRYQPIESRLKQFAELDSRTGFAISVKEVKDKELISKILDMDVKIIVIDTAIGHNNLTIDAVKELRDQIPGNIHIMSGNVSSFNAYQSLMDAGCDSVRVGIGGGSACTTRIVTGFGVPTMSSIMDIYNNLNPNEVNGIVADSGIRNSGDIVKSFAAGASAVMMGSLFAGHDECDGDNKTDFRGLASFEIQYEASAENPQVEGVSGSVPYRGSVINTINNLRNGLVSGMSYGAAKTIKQLQETSEYIVVSEQVVRESLPRV